MKQKINTLLASLALLLCSITMSAQTFKVDGIKYTVYNENEVYVSSGSQYEGDLIIPESVAYSGNDYKVTSIGKSAFFFCDGLTSVIIPNSVKIIGEDAFCGCSGLTSVTIGNSVIEIKQGAFSGCRKLKTVINFSVLFFKRGEGWPHGGIAFYAKNVVNARNGSLVGDYVFDGYNALCGYVGDETDLTLPENHNGENYAIGSNAFSGCSALTSVVIPSSVTSIGSNAFSGCSALISVVIPISVTSIGSNAFSGCSSLPVENDIRYADCYLVEVTDVSLQTYTIKAGTRFIGSSAFSGCSSLLSVTIPNSVTSIGYEAFGYCSALTSVTIGSGVKSIGDYAFDGCSGLTSVTIPNSVTSIGNAAFSGCSGLTSVTIGNSVTSLGEMAFYGCSGLTSVTIGNSVTSIGYEAFEYCSALTSVTIPSSVEYIGDKAFYECSNLKQVINFSNLRFIGKTEAYGYIAYYASKVVNAPNGSLEGDYVFGVIEGKNTLCAYIGDDTELTLPENFKGENYVIGARAFSGYTSLTSVTIPNSVTSIGENAFYNCHGLKSVHISDIAAWCNIDFSSNPLYYAHHLYMNGEEVKDLVIPNSVTSIGESAFYWCDGLTSVTIPNSVTSIGENAFYNCHSLKSVHISDIAAWCNIVFSGSYSNPLNYAQHLYLNGEEVRDLVIPNSVTSIQDYVFQGCSGLTSVTIPNSITSIGYRTFYGCSGLRSVTIPSSVERIRDEAFYDCSNLKRVVNFSNLRFIEGSSDYGYIAYYADNVINAPNATIEGDYVFGVIDGKNTLCAYIGDDTELTLPENYKEENYVIGARAFSGCVSLTSVTIPNSVTSIGENAFSGCKMIAKITIGNGITSISEYAFADCESLEEVYCLAENVPTTPTNAFRGSYIELATLYVPKVALKRYKVNAPWSGFGEIAEFTQTYTITYILDGVEFKKESWEAGTKIKTPQAPEKEGHTFNGWENVPETMPANDIEIEGSYSVNKYLLTFKIEGEAISSEYVEYGAKVETPQAPEKEGHTFNGWEDVPETMPAMDIVLYGSYTVNIYKVYYYVGEELVHTDEVAYGESIPAYEYIPTNGDKFMGWDGEKYDTMPAHDVTYTANIVSSIIYINGDMSDYMIYDLNGRRIENFNNLKNGVYIVNGKMTIVKVN